MMKPALFTIGLVLLAAFSANAQSNDNRPPNHSSICVAVTTVDAPDEEKYAVMNAMSGQPGAEGRLNLLVRDAAKRGRTLTVYRGLQVIVPPAAQRDEQSDNNGMLSQPPMAEKTYIIPAHAAPSAPVEINKPLPKQNEYAQRNDPVGGSLNGGPNRFLPRPPIHDMSHLTIFLHETLTVTAHLGPGGTIPTDYAFSEKPLTIDGQQGIGLYQYSSASFGGNHLFTNNETISLPEHEIPGGKVHMVFLTVTILPPIKD